MTSKSKTFDPTDWYWQVASGFFSSKSGATIAATDPAYIAFVAAGGVASLCPDASGALTLAAITSMLSQAYGITFGAPATADLIAHANAKQVALRDGGITVNVGSASTPDEVNVASDVNGRTLVTGCVQLIGVASQASQPAPTFQWINNDGTQLTLTSTQMMAIGLKLGSFVQATYAALGTVLAAIANGSITTLSAIDAAAWPTTSL